MMDPEISRRIKVLEARLCELLDVELYLPVKRELGKSGVQHTLGQHKEQFKNLIEKELEEFERWLAWHLGWRA